MVPMSDRAFEILLRGCHDITSLSTVIRLVGDPTKMSPDKVANRCQSAPKIGKKTSKTSDLEPLSDSILNAWH
jgi:hypothetical protein